MQGCVLCVHINCAQNSKAAPRLRAAVHLTGREKVQAFRGVHIASAQIAQCQHAPANILLVISRHTTSFRILRLMPNPYWTMSALILVAERITVYRSRTIHF
jgi:hypothetical protein